MMKLGIWNSYRMFMYHDSTTCDKVELMTSYMSSIRIIIVVTWLVLYGEVPDYQSLSYVR